MKKTRNSIYDFSLNQINPKLFMFGLIAIMTLIIFYSCSTGDESINKSGKTETITASEKTKKNGNTETVLPISVQENVVSFSEEIFTNFGRLDVALNKNTNVTFNAETMQMLNSATNENDLKNVFENAGISNSVEVINILKNNVAIQQAFIEQNPSFYSLTVEKQAELLNASIGLTKNSYKSHIPIPHTELVGGPNCAGAFNRNIDECAEDFGVCAVFAVAGAYAGLAPGLLAAAYCMVTKITCDSRAKRDYKECVLTPLGSVPPPTGELTIHCDKFADSCWTTDSNGKYVGRYVGRVN